MCVPAAVASSWSNSTRGSLTIVRVPMLDVTELLSNGLKSSEKVTPVVGSAMRGLPPVPVDDVFVELQATAMSIAAIPTKAVNARQSILPHLFFESLSNWPTGVENRPFSLAPRSAGWPCSQHAAMWPDETAKLGGTCRLQMSIAYGHRG